MWSRDLRISSKCGAEFESFGQTRIFMPFALKQENSSYFWSSSAYFSIQLNNLEQKVRHKRLHVDFEVRTLLYEFEEYWKSVV